MTGIDALWDWPCGTDGSSRAAATSTGTTGAGRTQPWQVGAGALDVGAALDAVAAMKAKKRRR